MAITTKTFTTGLKNGFQTTWILGKVIFPITAIITILSYTPVIDWVIRLFTPLMGLIGLPGDAAIPLVLGNVLNLYAAIGAILSLDLTVKSIFILALMLSFSHNLIVETAVAKRIGVNPWMVVSVRLGLAIVSAIVINWVWQGGNELATYGLASIGAADEATGIAMIAWIGVKKAFLGIVQMAMVVVPLMIFVQFLKDLNILTILTRFMSPITSTIGISRNSGFTMLAGLLFGLAFGAGIILQSVKDEPLSKRDLHLLMLFLVACHAVIEDTLIFLPLGIPVWPLLLIRVGVAFVVTMLTSRIWKKALHEQLQKGESRI